MEADPIDTFCKMPLREATVFVEGNPGLAITPEDLFDAGWEILRRTSELQNGDEAEVYARGLISRALIQCDVQQSRPDEGPIPKEIVKKQRLQAGDEKLKVRAVKCIEQQTSKVKGIRARKLVLSLYKQG